MTAGPSVDLTLDAVIVAVTGGEPRVLVVDEEHPPGLPAGPLDAASDKTLDLAMRRRIREQTGLEVGYAEQLYTFGNRDRRRSAGPGRSISVAYLALVEESAPTPGAKWLGAYDLLPWEDHRAGTPPILTDVLLPALENWAEASPSEDARERVEVAFGPLWDGIRVIERYELLYQAGLVQERATDDGGDASGRDLPRTVPLTPPVAAGEALRLDHRRIVTVALSRLRGKLTYRPVVFELLPERFTLLELQRTVEALAGVPLHKQNFRRLIERSGLVEGTGERTSAGAGRPAELFRYRPTVIRERPRPGVGQPYR
ncbi:MAG: NUDIX domain-containing protein [Acidimicrobiales bacterium]